MEEFNNITNEEEELNNENEWLENLKKGRVFNPDLPNPKPIPSQFLNSKQRRAIGR